MGIKGKLWRVVRFYTQMIEAVSLWKANLQNFFNKSGGCPRLHIVAHTVSDLYQRPVESRSTVVLLS